MKYADALRELAWMAKRRGNQRLVMIYLHNLKIRKRKALTAVTVKGS